jgi:glycosyltransferase involved in cell wall biosynthesis
VKLLMTADAVGGVWTYAADLAAALVGHGVETVIASLGPPPSPEQRAAVAALAGVTLIDTGLPLDWLAEDAATVRAAADAIRALARETDADLVHLNSPVLAAGGDYPAPVVAAVHGCVATWWQAAHGVELPADLAWHEAMMRDGLAAADAVVAPSQSYAATVARCYGLAHAPQVIHNGRAALAATDAAAANSAFTAGRLWDRVKNTALLDRVAARVPIRAAGPVTAPHGETVATRHLDLLGTLDAGALARELAARPVFVSAATFEPFGLAVLEAAQAGCPLVLADIDTFRELWSDAAIFVREEDDYVAAIEALLADPADHAQWGERARARAARYTPAAMAAGFAALYAELLPAERVAA